MKKPVILLLILALLFTKFSDENFWTSLRFFKRLAHLKPDPQFFKELADYKPRFRKPPDLEKPEREETAVEELVVQNDPGVEEGPKEPSMTVAGVGIEVPANREVEKLVLKTPIGGFFDFLRKSKPAPKPLERNWKDFYPLPRRLALRAIEHKGIGYETGYATFEGLFAPIYGFGKVLPLVDLRLHHLDDNTYAANIGLVTRYVPETYCQIWGFNVYYDVRQGCLGTFNKMGAGLEVLGRVWDFRLNAYIPVGADEFKEKCVFNQYTGGYFMIIKRREESFWGGNVEVGVMALKSENYSLYLGNQGYYLNGDCGAAWGGKVRLRPQYKDMVAFEGSVSYDPIFKTRFQLELSINLPFYILSPREKNPGCISDKRVYQPVERFEIIPLQNSTCTTANF